MGFNLVVVIVKKSLLKYLPANLLQKIRLLRSKKKNKRIVCDYKNKIVKSDGKPVITDAIR